MSGLWLDPEEFAEGPPEGWPETLEHLNSPPRTGCCSAYAVPPLVILAITVTITLAAVRHPGSFPVPVAPAGNAAVSPGTGQISPVFTPEVQHWSLPITTWAAQAALDPNLVAVVMQIESCGDPRALSRAGAMGLFQVMPYHFAAADGPYLPDTNASRGLAYLSRAMKAAAGDPRLAFAGYNGGISLIGRPEWTWPAETLRYAYWGSGIYTDAQTGASVSPRLQEWLDAGGASLCRAARQRLNLQD